MEKLELMLCWWKYKMVRPPWKWCDSFSKKIKGLPWWLSGNDFTCQCRRQGFDPWPGKIPHDLEQLSLCYGAQEPQLLSLREPQSPFSATREATEWQACALKLESSPHSPQQQRPSTAKNKQILKNSIITGSSNSILEYIPKIMENRDSETICTSMFSAALLRTAKW